MLSRILQGVDRVLRALLAALIVAMVAAVTWQVVSRYLLGDPSSWTEELARFTLVWIGLLGGAHAYRRRLHLGLDLLETRLAGRARRLQSIAVHVTVAAFAATVLIGGGIELIRLAMQLGQSTPALGLPMGAVYAALPISGALMLLHAGVALFARPIDHAGERPADFPGQRAGSQPGENVGRHPSATGSGRTRPPDTSGGAV